MIALPLTHALSDIVIKQLRYKVLYHFTDVCDFAYQTSPTQILLTTRSLVSAEREASIAAYVAQTVRDLALVNRKFRSDLTLTKCLPKPRPDRSSQDHEAGKALFAAGVVADDEGHVLYKGFALQLIQALGAFVDKTFARLAEEEFRVPSSIALSKLNQLDYVATFYHHLCFVSHLNPSVETASSFPEKWAQRGDVDTPQDLYQSCALPGRALNPAVCLHVYPEFQAGKRPLPETGAWIRASGKVFRFESGNHSSLERLFEFTMHELVHMGPPNLVAENGRKLQDVLIQLAQVLQLESETVIANDMFIGNADEIRIFSQVSTRAKVELMARLTPHDRSLAVASLNLHGQHFTKPLAIDQAKGTDGQVAPATSLCLGIGIERLAYALACQHGHEALAIIAEADADDVIGKAGF